MAKGGARDGAGRPKSENPRGQHQVRATLEEWEIIKEFTAILKDDPERVTEIMARLKPPISKNASTKISAG